jgi:acetyl/propionyl-CoA carboxylase alpha subunit
MEVQRGEGGVEVTAQGIRAHVDIDASRLGFGLARVGDKTFEFGWGRRDNRYVLTLDGAGFALSVLRGRRRSSAALRGQGAASAVEVRAPLPGMVRTLLVRPGMRVAKGAPLLTLDAMKLENEIQSPGDGLVQLVHVRPGQSVEREMLLMTLKIEDVTSK